MCESWRMGLAVNPGRTMLDPVGRSEGVLAVERNDGRLVIWRTIDALQGPVSAADKYRDSVSDWTTIGLRRKVRGQLACGLWRKRNI
jgi:hypothetical protein